MTKIKETPILCKGSTKVSPKFIGKLKLPAQNKYFFLLPLPEINFSCDPSTSPFYVKKQLWLKLSDQSGISI